MKETHQIARYVDNRFRIAQKCGKPAPFICRVEKNSLTYYLPPPATDKA